MQQIFLQRSVMWVWFARFEVEFLLCSWLFWSIYDYFWVLWITYLYSWVLWSISECFDKFRKASTQRMYHTRHSNPCLITSPAVWFRALRFGQNRSLKVFMNNIPFSFNFRLQFVNITYHLLIIDQQKTGNRIFIFAGSIRLKQPHEWSRIPSSATNCTLTSSGSTQKSDLANGFSVVPIQALCSRLPKRLTLTALHWCYFLCWQVFFRATSYASPNLQ